MKKPTLQDILEEGIRYFAQVMPDNEYDLFYNPTRHKVLTILNVLDRGVQHYVQIAREEYKREKAERRSPIEEALGIKLKDRNAMPGCDGPDSSEGRRYE